MHTCRQIKKSILNWVRYFASDSDTYKNIGYENIDSDGDSDNNSDDDGDDKIDGDSDDGLLKIIWINSAQVNYYWNTIKELNARIELRKIWQWEKYCQKKQAERKTERKGSSWIRLECIRLDKRGQESER